MLPANKSCYFYFLHHLVGLVTFIILLNVNVNHFVYGLPSSSPLSNSTDGSVTLLSPSFSAQSVNSISNETVENVSCESRNSSCSSCVKSKKCFYCYSTSSCLPFNLKLSGCSSVKETAYGTCLVKFNVLAISLGSMAGVILLTIVITCCCCCNCQRKRSGWEVDNQKENLTMRGSVIRDNAFAKREERQRRVDEIKRKYGIPEKK
ncbi:pituitary tumor-transforming gene 1 protein-interacting protein-like [Panonychus citri]|uniref:pituitary tumor-transforming gene 1 protein-interacting protein-like n=1 Tax=Panonychus citri TaxID=50023 RepID=UPI0023073867|nr:pituitary tumor-transforming gene 1 protein-interacting protein-like [Panonychus citri]